MLNRVPIALLSAHSDPTESVKKDQYKCNVLVCVALHRACALLRSQLHAGRQHHANILFLLSRHDCYPCALSFGEWKENGCDPAEVAVFGEAIAEKADRMAAPQTLDSQR